MPAMPRTGCLLMLGLWIGLFATGLQAADCGVAFSDLARKAPFGQAVDAAHPVHHDPAWGQVDLAVGLDQKMYPVLAPWIRRYAAQRGLHIRVLNGTCGTSAGWLRRHQIDIGGYCCPPGRLDRLPGLAFHTLGIMPIAIITHPDNPVSGLSSQQVRDIFAGRLHRWDDLTDDLQAPLFRGHIVAVTRLHCQRRPGHWKLILPHARDFSTGSVNVGAIPDMIRKVAAIPTALGFVTLPMVTRYRDFGRVRVLAVDGVRPADAAAVAAGHYPFYQTVNLASWQDGPGAARARALLAWLRQQVTLRRVPGFVPWQALREAGWRFRGQELVGEPRNRDGCDPSLEAHWVW